MKSENALRARGNTYSNHRLRSKRVWGSWLTSDLKWNWFSNFPANGILYECIPHKDLYGVYSTLVIKHASFGILYVDYYWIYFLLIGAGNEDRLVSRILMYEPNKRLLSKKGLCSCTSCIPTIIVSYQSLENLLAGPFREMTTACLPYFELNVDKLFFLYLDVFLYCFGVLGLVGASLATLPRIGHY